VPIDARKGDYSLSSAMPPTGYEFFILKKVTA
jgi:hypothetical protein